MASTELIGKRVNALRKALKLTQTEFASALSIRQQTLSMIESGRMDLSEKNIKLICFTYKVNYDWLVYGSGSMFQDDNSDAQAIISSILDGDDEFIKSTLIKFAKLDAKYWQMIKDILEELQKL